MTELFKQHGVVPDVIDKPPASIARITYPGNLVVDTGKELTPTQVKNEPTVTWNADPAAFYTICFTDPGAPNATANVTEWHHWLVGNIPGGDVTKGDVLSAFVGSGPPKNTGLHRYTFLIYKQPGKIEFDEPRLTSRSPEGRANFSAKKFAAKYKLGDPVAGNFFLAQYDDYVPIHCKLLGEC